MEKIAIKKENMANRCEICHKADKFYPKKNYCQRCYPFVPKQNKTNIAKQILIIVNKIIFLLWNILFLSIPLFIGSIIQFCGILLYSIVEGILYIIGLGGLEITSIIFYLIVNLGFIYGFIFGVYRTINLFKNNIPWELWKAVCKLLNKQGGN